MIFALPRFPVAAGLVINPARLFSQIITIIADIARPIVIGGYRSRLAIVATIDQPQRFSAYMACPQSRRLPTVWASPSRNLLVFVFIFPHFYAPLSFYAIVVLPSRTGAWSPRWHLLPATGRGTDGLLDFHPFIVSPAHDVAIVPLRRADHPPTYRITMIPQELGLAFFRRLCAPVLVSARFIWRGGIIHIGAPTDCDAVIFVVFHDFTPFVFVFRRVPARRVSGSSPMSITGYHTPEVLAVCVALYLPLPAMYLFHAIRSINVYGQGTMPRWIGSNPSTV